MRNIIGLFFIVGSLQFSFHAFAESEFSPEGLSIDSKAKKITDLQRGATRKRDEKLIKLILLSTYGEDLSKLKLKIDLGGDRNDFEKLIYHDINDKEIRSTILTHVKNEAASVDLGEVKILSDIDDTFYATVNDDRYPKKTVYPGVIAFYQALDRHIRYGIERKPLVDDLVFLTARPSQIENATHTMLKRRLGKESTILSGSLIGLFTHKAMAKKKLKNFKNYQTCYPEYDYVWIGDSGQGDPLLGADLLDQYSDVVKAVFIHDLGNIDDLSDSRQKIFERGDIITFHTYLGAAISAYRLKLIDISGLHSVKIAVETVMNAEPEGNAYIHFENDEQRDFAFRQLTADVIKANRFFFE